MSMVEARIGDLAEQVRGVTYGKQDASKVQLEGYLPVLRAGNITESGLTYEDLIYVPASKISDKQKIRQGDIIVAASSGSLDVVGKAAPALNDFDGGFGAFCKVLRPNKKVNPRYFAQLFKRPEYRRTVSSLAAGANINNLRNEHLDDMRVPVPSLDEQRRIAVILDHADALRARRREALAQLDSLTQSIFIEMFGDPVENAKGLPIETLGALCTRITDGTHLSPKWETSGVPFLFISNIVEGQITFDTHKFISADTYHELTRRCPIELGDVLYTTVGSYGNAAVVNTTKQFAFQRHIAHIKLDSTKAVPTFIAAMIQSTGIRRQVDKVAKGVAQKTVNLADLRSLLVFAPPLVMQQTFAARILSIESLKVNHRTALQEMNKLFASLQHRAFQGNL